MRKMLISAGFAALAAAFLVFAAFFFEADFFTGATFGTAFVSGAGAGTPGGAVLIVAAFAGAGGFV